MISSIYLDRTSEKTHQSLQYFYSKADFPLEAGGSLAEVRIAYQTFGKLNARKDNVVWVCHALTANSDVADWWGGLFGDGKPFDSSKYFTCFHFFQIRII